MDGGQCLDSGEQSGQGKADVKVNIPDTKERTEQNRQVMIKLRGLDRSKFRQHRLRHNMSDFSPSRFVSSSPP
jgi:hypothetical protein